MKIGLFLLSGFICIAGAHASLEQSDIPPGTDLRWVGREMLQNDRQMQVAILDSKLSVDEVVSFYSDLWQHNQTQGSPGSITEQLREWSIVSTVVDNSLLVVQVKAGKRANQTSGFISSMSLDTALTGAAVGGPEIPQLPGSFLISRTHSTDFNHARNNQGQHSAKAEGLTTIFLNDSSVASNYEFYTAVMQERGWKLVADKFNHSSAALIFSKSDRSSEIALSEIDGLESVQTLVVTNQVSTAKR